MFHKLHATADPAEQEAAGSATACELQRCPSQLGWSYSFPAGTPIATSLATHNLPYAYTSQQPASAGAWQYSGGRMAGKSSAARESQALKSAKAEWERQQSALIRTPKLSAPLNRKGFAAVGRTARRLASAINDLAQKDLNYLVSLVARLQGHYPSHESVRSHLVQTIDQLGWIGATEGRKSGAPRDVHAIAWLHIAARSWVEAGLKPSISAGGRFFKALEQAAMLDRRIPKVSAGTLRGNLKRHFAYPSTPSALAGDVRLTIAQAENFKLLPSPSARRGKVQEP